MKKLRTNYISSSLVCFSILFIISLVYQVHTIYSKQPSTMCKFNHSTISPKVAVKTHQDSSSPLQHTTTTTTTTTHNTNHIINNTNPNIVATSDRILYLNRHYGTSSDLKHVAKQIGFTFSELNSAVFTDYGQTPKRVDELNKKGKFAEFICTMFDVVIVADVNTDARFLLSALDNGNCQSLRRLIMITTNRFDLLLNEDDKKQYMRLLGRVSNRVDTKVTWIANNPFEPRYAKVLFEHHGLLPLTYTIIRPFGITYTPDKSGDLERFQHGTGIPSESMYSVPVMVNHPSYSGYFGELVKAGIRVKLLPQRYGGSRVLAKYKCVIEVPYQVSTMKTYENLANGVVTYIPSVEYLRNIINSQKYPSLDILADTYTTAKSDWYKMFECYNDRFKDYFYTFDSLDDLKLKLASSRENGIDPRNVKSRAPEMYKSVQQESLSSWRQVFSEYLV